MVKFKSIDFIQFFKMHDTEAVDSWKNCLEITLKKLGDYFLVHMHDMVGSLLIIFAKENIK
jgi:hypothetical protein